MITGIAIMWALGATSEWSRGHAFSRNGWTIKRASQIVFWPAFSVVLVTLVILALLVDSLFPLNDGDER